MKISIHIPDGTVAASFTYVFRNESGVQIGCTVFDSKDLFNGACLRVPDTIERRNDMVHVKTCPLVASGKSNRRGMASTEFYRNGVPQIYCYGFMNSLTGEPLKECQECLDWAYGDQVSRDISQSVEQEG